MQAIFTTLYPVVFADLMIINLLSEFNNMKGYKMKKLFSILSMALPLAMAAQAGDALAQRPNHTKKDVTAAYTEQATDSRAMDKKEIHKHHDGKKEHKKHNMKDAKHQGKMFGEERKEIEEDYNKAMHSIEKSSFNANQKGMLKKQADENRKLVLSQIDAREKLAKEHMEARKASEEFQKAVKAEKSNRKVLKKINEILD